MKDLFLILNRLTLKKTKQFSLNNLKTEESAENYLTLKDQKVGHAKLSGEDFAQSDDEMYDRLEN